MPGNRKGWRIRRNGLKELLRNHPVSSQELVDLGHCETLESAGKVLRRLCEKKHARLVGFKQSGRRGPQPAIYFSRPMAPYLVQHEYTTTRAVLAFGDALAARGKNVDQQIKPDAELWFDDPKSHLMLEIDNATERLTYVRTVRMPLYLGCQSYVLWVAPNLARCDQLQASAKDVGIHALFATLDELLTSNLDAQCIDSERQIRPLRQFLANGGHRRARSSNSYDTQGYVHGLETID